MDKKNMRLEDFEFQPLSWVKARLSEIVKNVAERKKRIILTTNGRPSAVLVSYDDFLEITSGKGEGGSVVKFEDWKKERRNKEKVRDSIVGLFDMTRLSRKGQKKYKEETVRELNR